MAITRRDFLKISGITGAGIMFGVFDLKPIVAYAAQNEPIWETFTTSICCYCGVGCGLLVGSKSTAPYATYVQGDPDHPINQGTLCSKGQSVIQQRTVDGALNPKRVLTPLKRDPLVDKYNWIPISWNQALNEIAAKIKSTRDGNNPHHNPLDPASSLANTITEELIDGVPTPVNRCRGIANFGGAALDNEECYILAKLMRALGLVYIEHQARI